MKLIILILALVVVVNCAYIFGPQNKEERVSYDNYAVYKLKFTQKWQRNIINDLMSRSNGFDLWSSNAQAMHLMVSPEERKLFENLTASEGIETELWISDVQSVLNDEKRADKLSRAMDSNEFAWNQYHTMDEINDLLDDFLHKYSNVTEEIIIGKTHEGRTITGIKISYKSGNPGVYIESNIHAREWITSATAIWFINQLLTSMQAEVRELAENHDWYIIPVFNVDGFVYSHNVDRMWRKNRRVNEGSKCFGVDLNRNFNSHWMEGNGASQDPCASDHAGKSALSEPESIAEAKYVLSILKKINLFIGLHSYSQLVIPPWGYTLEKPQNAADLEAVGNAFINAVAALPYKTKYRYGPVIEVLDYSAAGVTSDWAYDQGVKLSYTIEVRDDSYYGFILPPSQILSNCEEIMAGLLAMTKKAKEMGLMTANTQ